MIGWQSVGRMPLHTAHTMTQIHKWWVHSRDQLQLCCTAWIATGPGSPHTFIIALPERKVSAGVVCHHLPGFLCSSSARIQLVYSNGCQQLEVSRPFRQPFWKLCLSWLPDQVKSLMGFTQDRDHPYQRQCVGQNHCVIAEAEHFLE